MDSSTLLLHLLANGVEVTALSFDYGQKHKVELECAKSLCMYLEEKGHKVRHQVIELNGLAPLLNSALVEGGDEVPEGHYEEENMKETVVPNRNKIFSSIIQAVALSLQPEDPKEGDVVIAMGIHAGDHAIYPDCREEFRNDDYKAFVSGNWNADTIKYYTPYMEDDKAGILKDGAKACEKLKVDFNEVYKRTNTSYKPIVHDGGWYSDFKSASSVERIEAFIQLGKADPVAYADENGPVDWEIAKAHVEQVLRENNAKNTDTPVSN